MRLPYWLLKRLPLFDYVCPKCRREVEKNSRRCVYCGERYGVPVRVPPKVLKDKKALEDYVHQHVFPTVSQAQRDYLTQYFTVIFSDGFGSGDATGWNAGINVGAGGAVTFVNAPVHHGNWAMKAVTTAGAGDWAEVLEYFGGAYTTVYARGYVQFATLPALGEAAGFIELGDWNGVQMGNPLLELGVGYSGGAATWRLRYLKNGAYAIIYAGTPTAGEWHCLEAGITVDAANGMVVGSVDGSLLLQDSVFDNDDYGNAVTLIFGRDTWDLINYNDTMYGDCVVVADVPVNCEGIAWLGLTGNMVFMGVP